jgi:hypothetical protein
LNLAFAGFVGVHSGKSASLARRRPGCFTVATHYISRRHSTQYD